MSSRKAVVRLLFLGIALWGCVSFVRAQQFYNLTAEQRKGMVYGQKLYITFEGKVMHFFDKETQKNLIYG